ncbi:MAG: hypothetical protein QNJ63_16145 [Calothrix sp. MO_192.B10]|nr:hypothetical protein [Calothrix sp. MO_192.B10]
MMKKVVFQSVLLSVMGIFSWGLYSSFPTGKLLAQDPYCANYWTNPRTGYRECLNLGSSSRNQIRKPRQISNTTQNFNSTKPKSNYLLLSKHLISCHNQAEICDNSQRDKALYVTIKIKNTTNKLVSSKVFADVYSNKFKGSLTYLTFRPVDKNASNYLKPGKSALLHAVLYNSYLPEGYKLRDLYFDNLR